MPTKQTASGREYDIDGKKFVWHPLDENDEAGNLPDVTIPLRLKLKVVRSLGGRTLDNDVMFEMLEALIPNQTEVLDEMDVNDFQDMFGAWQEEYNSVTGADLGESSASSA
jgi:hypothetical protein